MVSWSQRDAVWERGQIFSFPGETQTVWVQGDRTELLDAKVAWNSVRVGSVWGRRDLIWRKREWGLKEGIEFGGIGITMAWIWQWAVAIAVANQTSAGDPQHINTKGIIIPSLPGWLSNTYPQVGLKPPSLFVLASSRSQLSPSRRDTPWNRGFSETGNGCHPSANHNESRSGSCCAHIFKEMLVLDPFININ